MTATMPVTDASEIVYGWGILCTAPGRNPNLCVRGQAPAIFRTRKEAIAFLDELQPHLPGVALILTRLQAVYTVLPVTPPRTA